MDNTPNEINRSEVLSQPFFVVGPLRSGTTLLRLLLDHHPEINCFGEFEGAVSQADGNAWPDLAAYHDFVEIDRQTSSYNFEIDRSLKYEDLVRDFLAQLYDRNPKPLLGASVHSRMDLIPKIWPNAKFIKLHRDPRDVSRSCIGMGWTGNVYKGSDYWIEPEKHWDILKNTVPENQLCSLAYEELVSDPEKELTKIAKFLGCDYSPKMLDIDGDTTYSKPDSTYAQQWKRKLNQRQIELVEYKCSPLMEERGYSLTNATPRKPNIIEKVFLGIQHVSYRIKFNIQSFGFPTWFIFAVTKRIGWTSLNRRMLKKMDAIRISQLK